MEHLIDTMLDYTRLVAYALVILTSLRGIAYRKFSGLLFVGDIVLSIGLFAVVIYIHLFEISVQSTLVDDYILTVGAVVWAIIHFVAMLKNDKTKVV